MKHFPSAKQKSQQIDYSLRLVILLSFACWIYLYQSSTDRTDWWIENILVILFTAALIMIRHTFRFSRTSLFFILAFLMLHLYGAQGAYTHNSFGELLQNTFHLARNPYDRIVHFSFGFLLAYPMAEVLHRKFGRSGAELHLAVTTAILSLAAIFELIEWGVAACTNAATGESYVATQGDPWDAQKDIILALIGCILFRIIYNIFCRLKSIVPKF